VLRILGKLRTNRRIAMWKKGISDEGFERLAKKVAQDESEDLGAEYTQSSPGAQPEIEEKIVSWWNKMSPEDQEYMGPEKLFLSSSDINLWDKADWGIVKQYYKDNYSKK
jgi:hypothetical protein